MSNVALQSSHKCQNIFKKEKNLKLQVSDTKTNTSKSIFVFYTESIIIHFITFLGHSWMLAAIKCWRNMNKLISSKSQGRKLYLSVQTMQQHLLDTEESKTFLIFTTTILARGSWLNTGGFNDSNQRLFIQHCTEQTHPWKSFTLDAASNI